MNSKKIVENRQSNLCFILCKPTLKFQILAQINDFNSNLRYILLYCVNFNTIFDLGFS